MLVSALPSPTHRLCIPHNYLTVFTTCVSAGMIAMGAVLGNTPGISRTVSCPHLWMERGIVAAGDVATEREAGCLNGCHHAVLSCAWTTGV